MEIKDIKEIIRVFEQSGLEFLEVSNEKSHIKMKKPKISVSKAPQNNNILQVEPKEMINNYTEIKSPVVGVFYASPSPENPPFVSVGQSVQKGDVIGLIEAMKVMSEIKASADGVVREILVSNEQLVAFGDVLVQIEE
ncbi:MAG: acetyl-CoA carboxylase [Clostridia bacterium]